MTTSLNRREALKLGVMGSASLALGRPLRETLTPPPPKPRARSVIQIWMWGGPSHLDTFDPKPAAGSDYCGPLTRPVATNVEGMRIGQLLPLLAKQADKFSLIRSMTHGINGHETASYMVQTGHEPGRLVHPSIGAVVGLFKGYEHGYEGLVPPYIVLTQPQGRFSESGFLGLRYKPFATGGDPRRTPFAVEGLVSKGISDERQLARRRLLDGLDTLGGALPGSDAFRRHDGSEAEAWDMMFGAARKLFDLTTEGQAVRERYGMTTFGQSCLVARRLVEHGVPWVTINYRGWDTHKQHFQIMQRRLPEFDRGLASLLADLSKRGLLDSTIVWCGGEFGRTPKVQWEPPWNGGRGHFGNCFSYLVAGGGFRGGHVVGSSDARGLAVVRRPVHPRNLIGSIYTLLGIDPEGPLPNPRGLDVKVLENAREGDGMLREIMRS